jgi:hypothetical protein
MFGIISKAAVALARRKDVKDERDERDRGAKP